MSKRYKSRDLFPAMIQEGTTWWNKVFDYLSRKLETFASFQGKFETFEFFCLSGGSVKPDVRFGPSTFMQNC